MAENKLQMLGALVERVRVSLEEPAKKWIERAAPNARTTYVMPKSNVRRRELLGTSLLLTDSMAPHLYAHARTALTNLRIDDSVELYQEDGAHPNAHAVLPGAPLGIKLTGDFASMLSGDELVALFGHEFGHCVAHASNAEFAWARAVGHAGLAKERASARLFLLASEITADRFALLASRSLSATLRLHMRTIAGKGSHFRLDPKAYLTQARALADEALRTNASMLGDTHPEHYLRSYATWLFWESDLYAALSGKGPAKRTMAEIDTILARLLGVKMVTRASAPPAPEQRSALPQVALTAPRAMPQSAPQSAQAAPSMAFTREKSTNRAMKARARGRR